VGDPQFEVSLVAPCLNEAENVSELAERFFLEAEKNNVNAEIVFIDDGSTDQTLKVIELLKLRFAGKVQVIQHITNNGIPASWLTGTEHALGRHVCLIDSDLQNPPESVFQMLGKLVNEKADLVRAVRRPVANLSAQRFIMSRTLNFCLNKSFRMSSEDNKSGFVIARKDDMLKIVTPRGQYRHFQTFVGASANFHKLKTIEIETTFYDRRAGISFMRGKTIRIIFEVFKDLSQARRQYRVERVSK
jgi:phenylacetate-CoA ligase